MVSALGFGAGHIGDTGMDEAKVASLLNEVLDSGINLIDTARSYGESENRIGRHLAHRRHEFILSTKVGYTYRDYPDWSYEATLGTIEESLTRLRTDYLDIVHLHSCDLRVLEQGDAIVALERAREQGKIRVTAYSGENDALAYAINTGRFVSIQCSASIFDQKGIDTHIRNARKANLGIIAKRPLGNAIWRYNSRPDGHGHAIYYDRYRNMRLEPGPYGWEELALRFVAWHSGTDCLITGTSDPGHLAANLDFIEKGPLDAETVNRIRSAFNAFVQDKEGLI